MDVYEKSDLCLGEKVINHLSDALPVEDPMVDVFFIFRVDIRLEVAN